MKFLNGSFFIIFLSFLLINSFAKGVEIKGIKDPLILSMIKGQLISEKKGVANSKDSVSTKYKLESDKELITTVLHSFGYFDCAVDYKIINDKITFQIALNERYKFNEVLLEYEDDATYFSGLKVGEVFELININFDSYATTKEIFNASAKIKEFFKSKGFAFASISSSELNIEKEKKKIKVIYRIKLNGKIIIDTTIINIKSDKNSQSLLKFVKNRIAWKDGDIYDLNKINQTKEDLVNSGIFSGIEINLSEPKKDPYDKTLSHTTATINLEEAMLKEITAGIKYGTSEKLGASFSWSHYNIDGKSSKLTTLLNVAKNEKTAKIKYDAYDLFYKKQQLSSQIFYDKENALPYDVSKIGTESVLWQEFSKGFKVGLGGCFESANTKDKIEPSDTKTEFKGMGIPISVSLDATDSFLDPKKGFRCYGKVTPYFGDAGNFTIATGKASFYLPLSKNNFQKPMVFAFYSKMGSIIRDEKEKMPRDRLFFAGGADSVRGYGYQKLGSINKDKRPFGGRSFFEFGLEPRIKIKEDLGAVIFLEGGNVYSSRVPRFSKKMLFGYGFGIRYYTQLGPIRIDIAFPTERRKTPTGKKVDSLFNVYISIGQSF